MLLKREFSSLIRTSYKNWQSLFLLAAIPILLYISILEVIFAKKTQVTYDKDVKELEVIQKSKEEDLQQLSTTATEYVLLVKKLSNCLLKYQLPLTGGLTSGNPEVFQRKWEQDTCIINAKAKRKHVLLPPEFCLGLESYKETTLSSEEVITAIKQEIFLNWIAHQVVIYPNLIVKEFRLENKNSLLFSTSNCSAFLLGYLVLSVTTNEASLQQIINNITTGPYFLIIKKLVVENSSQNSPSRTVKGNLLKNTAPNIKIIFGKEKNTVWMVLQLVELRG